MKRIGWQSLWKLVARGTSLCSSSFTSISVGKFSIWILHIELQVEELDIVVRNEVKHKESFTGIPKLK